MKADKPVQHTDWKVGKTLRGYRFAFTDIAWITATKTLPTHLHTPSKEDEDKTTSCPLNAALRNHCKENGEQNGGVAPAKKGMPYLIYA